MHITAGLRPYFRAAAILGVLLLIGDMILSAKFGLRIALEMGIIVAAISLGSGIMPVLAYYLHRAGLRGPAIMLALAWAPAFAFNVWSNVGVSTANRMGEVQQAAVQQATYAEAQQAVTEAEGRVAALEAQLQSLLSQHAWAATVTADGLREKAATLAAAITEEGSAKNGGCKKRCLALMAQKAEVDEQIAVAEQRQDLTQQIELTGMVLAKAREQAAQTEAGISATANQSSLYAKLVAWDLGGDPDQRAIATANEATGIFTAFVLALMAAVVTFIGALPHLLATPWQRYGRSVSVMDMPAVSAPAANSVQIFREHTSDRSTAEAILAAIGPYRRRRYA